MAVETDGTILMRGDMGPGVPVHVSANKGRLRIESDSGLVGDWLMSEMRISVLHEGFAIRADGEDFVLKAIDDVGVAEELGVAAAAPRMARRLAVRHNTERPIVVEPEAQVEGSHVPDLAFALGGAMVLIGGVLLGAAERPLVFFIGGAMMVAVGYLMSTSLSWARIAGIVLLGVLVLAFGLILRDAALDVNHVTAYAFVAGGIVVGMAVIIGGSIRSE